MTVSCSSGVPVTPPYIWVVDTIILLYISVIRCTVHKTYRSRLKKFLTFLKAVASMAKSDEDKQVLSRNPGQLTQIDVSNDAVRERGLHGVSIELSGGMKPASHDSTKTRLNICFCENVDDTFRAQACARGLLRQQQARSFQNRGVGVGQPDYCTVVLFSSPFSVCVHVKHYTAKHTRSHG